MTKSEIKTALVTAGLNKYLVLDQDWQQFNGRDAIHVKFDDLDTCAAGRISALMAKCDTEMTDKGILFVVA